MVYTRNYSSSTHRQFNGGQSFMDALLLLGVVIGITISIGLAAFANTMAAWFASVHAFNKPQKIELYTTETPAEVKRRSDRAGRFITFVNYTSGLLLWLVIDYLFPPFALRVYDAFIDFLVVALSLIRDLALIGLDSLRF